MGPVHQYFITNSCGRTLTVACRAEVRQLADEGGSYGLSLLQIERWKLSLHRNKDKLKGLKLSVVILILMNIVSLNSIHNNLPGYPYFPLLIMTKSTLPQIHLIIGARPNYMKADPVYKALQATGKFKLSLVHTGQHYDHRMSQLFFDELGMQKPHITLEVGSGSHGVQTARILERYEKVLLDNAPGLVMVFGDVNSTIACALAAVKLHIPVAHVEAGLRSGDRQMPEEINRVLTDQISQLLLITSRDAEDNLVNEGVAPNRIHFVGNTMIDSLMAFQDKFDQSEILQSLGITNRFALITLHRPSNVDSIESLTALVAALEKTSEKLELVFPIHPRTRNRLADFGLLDQLEKNTRCHLLDPLGYIDFMRLQRDAAVVITDSGGIQEESTCFGVPCLTVRDNTERPVTISDGTNKLIGTNYNQIPVEVNSVLDQPINHNKIPELWDGQSGKRIADILVNIDFEQLI